MKKVLLYYNFSYPVGGGDYLPLVFAAALSLFLGMFPNALIQLFTSIAGTVM